MKETETLVIDVKVTAENIQDKTYFCNELKCFKKFNSEKSLKKHLCEHFDSKASLPKVLFRFNCPILTCRRSLKMENEFFNSRKLLCQHFFKVHNSGKFACENGNCEKKFSTELLRKLHLKNCGKTFECFCSQSFNSSEALQTHQRRKHPSIPRNRKNKMSSVESNNNDLKKKSETRSVSTTTSGLWNSAENSQLSLPSSNNMTSVFTSTDKPIANFESKSTTTAPELINTSTSTTDDPNKEENSNSLSSFSSHNKKTLNWNSGEFDDSINIFDTDVKMEFFSAETQTDFTENLFNNNYTQTTFSDFYDFEKFDIQTQTNWDE